MTKTQDIETLVKKCQAGDRESLGILYQTYLAPMKEVVSYYVRDKDAVWDILHDGFLIAFASITSLRKPLKVKSWLTSIMKNLALQYLKAQRENILVPISEEPAVVETKESENEEEPFSWDELSRIIDRLPQGYCMVFRLAVLENRPHKEIGEMLGIAPHSSSSQLVRAKAMLRRLISQYGYGAGVMSVILLLLAIWHFLPSGSDERHAATAVGIHEPITAQNELRPSAITAARSPESKNIAQKRNPLPLQKQLPDSTALNITANISPIATTEDSVRPDSVKPVFKLFDGELHFSQQQITLHRPGARSPYESDWSLTLAYYGNSGRNSNASYYIPNPDSPDLPSGDPDAEIEVNDTKHHQMPVIIGLSVNKTLSPRWSVETGLRYSFMESEFSGESKLWTQRTKQQIHYIGIPLKFNYNILTAGNFALYGHGGGALDIPVRGRKSSWKLSIGMTAPVTAKHHIHPPLQWSVEAGFGIRYNFTPSLSIFAEPSLHYYFNPGGEIRTIRQEKPLEFALPVGFRLTW